MSQMRIDYGPGPSCPHRNARAAGLGGLDALAVDDRGRGAGVAPDPFAICHHERVVYPFKAPVVAPGGEPAVNRPPWRQIVRHKRHGQPRIT